MLKSRQFRQPAKPERKPMAWPSPIKGGTVARCDAAAVASPKGEKAKPGKRAPTAEERRWMDWIVRRGCIACWLDSLPPRPTAVHHILRGGVRMGHLFTLGLCDPGHHQSGQSLGMVSRHPWKAQFEARYGTEMQLLAILQKEYSRI